MGAGTQLVLVDGRSVATGARHRHGERGADTPAGVRWRAR